MANASTKKPKEVSLRDLMAKWFQNEPTRKLGFRLPGSRGAFNKRFVVAVTARMESQMDTQWRSDGNFEGEMDQSGGSISV